MADKKGGVSLTLSTLIVTILLIVFLLTGIAIFRPLYSSDFQFSMKEQVCRFTLATSKYFDVIGIERQITPLCSARIVALSSEEIESYGRYWEEPAKESTMHYFADLMLRCAKTYDIPSREGIVSHDYCHICYVTQPDKKNPVQTTFTPEEFKTYLLSTETPRGKNYYNEMFSGNSKYLFALNTQELFPGKIDYAIFYVDNVKPSTLPVWSAPFLCLIGPISCWSAVAASTSSLIQQFGATNTDLLITTELKEARKYCREVISS